MATINSNIALGVQPIQLNDPLAQYGKISAIQGAQQQNELARMKMAEYERTRADEDRLRNYLAQSDLSTPEGRTGLVKFGTPGLAYGKALSEQDTANLTREKTQFELQKAKREFISQAQRDTSQNPSDANITAFKEDLMANPLFTEAEKTRMVAGADRILSMPVNERSAFMASQGASASELKPSVQQINQGGQTQMLRVPAFGGAPTTVGTYADVPLPDAVQAQKMQTAKAGAPNISLSTEKKYGEAFGTKIAEADINKLATAEKAPQLAESANRIIDIVRQGNVFTGPVADIKLNIARALNVAGANNQEKIANTEQLIAATGQSTLDAIKSAGLGAGQGFTDKDLKFLQGVAGGTITLTAQTLTELATLQHRAATRSAEAWKKRVGEMPKEVVQGVGLSTAPITIPPLTSVMKKPAAARPEGVGANWTFERDAAGNTAWVSPDRKSFKEAK
jgi:hypothetical protein